MKTIYEASLEYGNNEGAIKAGIYQNADGSFFWLTLSRSGECKRLATAMKHARVSKEMIEGFKR